MSLYSAFYSGLSGLSTNASALNVIGNNLSNLNTVGFKGSSTTFRDIFSSTGASATQGNGNPIQFGLGVQTNSVNQDFSQSSFQSTGNALDMAIQGNGFFTLQTPSGGQVFSRAGNFTRNNLGFLVASDGSSVMGWNRGTNGLSTTGAMVPIQISATTPGAQATQNFSLGINLNAAATTGTTFQTPIQVYDSLGQAQNLMVTYTKAAATNTWTYTVADTATPPATFAPAVAGTIVFDTDGTILSLNGGSPPSDINNSTLNITWPGGSGTSAINFNIIEKDGTQNLTGLSSPSTTISSTQDGFPTGTLRDLTVDQNGLITGNFTNGQILPMAQLALSAFTNVNGLQQSGNNHWGQTLASGAPVIGLANQGGRGAILGSNLELSNVDVASEFTKLIVSQRGYQANSRIVTTTDELLQETLNLKR
ncbi:MAG TPA: flagellar hook protein FlgE [Geothrix sp.]|jgi:flagellar hook protein FlgE